MGQIYEKSVAGKVQADSSWEITEADDIEIANATRHQVSLVPGGATSGTVAVLVKPYGCSLFEPLTINGVAVTLNIASPRTAVFEGNISAFRFTPTSVTGGDGTYGAAVSGWRAS